jgi:tRNA U34 2-thiouridine synthase MnmA/TrmU
MERPVKALGLISGGLDSTLALALMREQEIDVEAVNFSTGFCMTDHHREMGSKRHRLRNEALRAGADLRVPVTIIDISENYFDDVLINPRHGYGANMNPCLDCRIYMLAKAREHMESVGARFIFTGEVLGQRPMSQYRRALRLVAEKSGVGDRLLRPLSAKLLEPTLPEREGWVDRERLLGISGRSRKVQIEEAGKRGLDVSDIPQPAGGCCFLTDEAYSRKLRDYLDHGGRELHDAHSLLLLKAGRHLRLNDEVKIIVARDESENDFFTRFRPGRWDFRARDFTGPLVLVECARELSFEEKRAVAAITARYGRGREEESVVVSIRPPGRAGETLRDVEDRAVEDLEVSPAGLEAIEPLRV